MNKLHIWIMVLALVVLGYVVLNRQTLNLPVTKEKIFSPSAKVSTECSGKVTAAMTEGPYYKVGSPQRTNLKETRIPGILLTVTGFIFDQNCQPVSGAWLDFWQADGEGNYDNVGFKLRGHQLTDQDGRYILETVIPGEYPGRTPHIHVKVRASTNSAVLISQLFLPDAPGNQKDPIFDSTLVMDIKDVPVGKEAKFNFVLQ